MCDSSGYVLDVLKKYTGVDDYSDYDDDAATRPTSTRS